MPFSPSSLFGAGEFGYALDVLDSSKLWQDTAGTQTTPAADTQPIGRIDDVSGNGNHFTVEGANSTRRPLYDATDADDCPIDFDGSNDALTVSAVGLFAASGCTIVARIKGAGAQNKHFFCEGGTANSNVCYAPGLSTLNVAADAGGRYFIANDAGTAILNTGSAVAVFDNSVHTVVIEDTGSSILMTVDGVAGTSRSYTRSGTFTLAKTALGCLYRNAVQSLKAASMGRLIAIDRALNATELQDAIDWVENNTATGVTGTLAATEGADTASFAGDVLVDGSFAVTESGSDTAAFNGTSAVITSGTLAATESGSDTASLNGTVPVQGSLSAAESGSDTFAGSGSVTVQGSISASETGSDTASFTGDTSSGPVGSFTVVETGNDAAAFVAKLLIEGSFTISEADTDTFSATGPITAGANIPYRIRRLRRGSSYRDGASHYGSSRSPHYK